MHTLGSVCWDPVTRSYFKPTFVVSSISLLAMNDTLRIHTKTIVVGDLFFFSHDFLFLPFSTLSGNIYRKISNVHYVLLLYNTLRKCLEISGKLPQGPPSCSSNELYL